MIIGIVIVMFLLNLLSKVMCDRKAFKEGGVEPSDGRGWLIKGALSFLLGKWHRWDAVRNMSFVIVVVIALGVSWYWCIIGYAVLGGLFNLLYKIKS